MMNNDTVVIAAGEGGDTNDALPVTSTTKKRKSVMIDESQNTIRRASSSEHQQQDTSDVAVSASALRLLNEAEQRVSLLSKSSIRSSTTTTSTPPVAAVLSISSVKHAITAVQKAYEVNAIQRAKVQEEEEEEAGDEVRVNAATTTAAAAIYMESEIALYECLVQLKAIAIDPILYYPLLLLKTAPQSNNTIFTDLFVPLLVHENIDIVITIVSVFIEWFDIDVSSTTTDTATTTTTTTTTLLKQLANELFASGVMELILDYDTNVRRMLFNSSSSNNNEDDDDDDDVGRGIDDVLSLVEQLLYLDTATISATPTSQQSSSSSSIAYQLCNGCTNFISYLFYIQQPETKKNTGTSNKESNNRKQLQQRSMELLTTITTREEIYTIDQLHHWTHLPPLSTIAGHDDTNHRQDSMVDMDGDAQSSSKVQHLPIDAIELVLQNVGLFRKCQPKDADEMEYLENCCIVMTSILTYSSSSAPMSSLSKTAAAAATTTTMISSFMERQGIELVIRCLKERVYAGATTLVWLDFSSSTGSHNDNKFYDNGGDRTHEQSQHNIIRQVNEYMVNVGILKYLFPLFMGKHLPKYYDDSAALLSITVKDNNNNTSSRRKQKIKRRKHEYYNKVETTTIRIMYNLVRYLQNDSPNDVKDRFITKFMDTNDNETYTKVNRLIDLYIKYDQQVRLAEYKFYQSDIEDVIINDVGNGNTNSSPNGTIRNDATMLLQYAVLDTKLKAGGDILYRLAAILAFCCCTSRQCHEQILEQLQRKQSGISIVKETLQEFISMLDDPSDQRIQLQQLYNQI